MSNPIEEEDGILFDPVKFAEDLAALEAAHEAEAQQDQAAIDAAAQVTQEKIEADRVVREEQNTIESAKVMESLTAPRQAMEALLAGAPLTNGEVVVEI